MRENFKPVERKIRYKVEPNGNLLCYFSDYIDTSYFNNRAYFSFSLVDNSKCKFGYGDFELKKVSIKELIEEHYQRAKKETWLLAYSYVDDCSNYFFDNLEEAIECAKEIYYSTQKPFSKYKVALYFDYHLDKYVSDEMTKTEARKLCDELNQKHRRYLYEYDIKPVD